MMEVMHYHNIVEDDDVVVNCRTSLPPRNLQNSFSALLENDDEDDLNVNTSILLNDFNETKEPIFSPQPLSPSHSSEVLLGSLFASNEKEKTIFQKPIPEEDGEIEIKEHLLQNNFINIITEQNTKITQVPVKETKQEIHTDNNSELDFPELRGKCRVLEKIGEGTFSSVFKGICLKTNRIVALKRICPTCSPERILNEMKHLHLLGGKCNVPKLLGGYRLHDQITLSMPYIEHDKFKDFLPTMTVSQIREYMRALFEALEHLHANKVIHRDVKPGNFLYHIKSNTFMLVDFGLAQTEQEIFAQADDSTIEPERTKSTTGPVKRKRSDGMDQYGSPGKRAKYPGVSPGLIRRSSITGETPNAKNSLKAPRGGTRGFRAPEVLLKYQKQSFSIDIWSAGVVLLCILSTRYPFFTAPDDLVSLAEIGALFGTKELKQAALLIQRKVTFPWDPVEIPKSSLKDVCNRLTSRSYQMPDSVFDLLNACLDLNPHTRITASEALKHPFFA